MGHSRSRLSSSSRTLPNLKPRCGSSQTQPLSRRYISLENILPTASSNGSKGDDGAGNGSGDESGDDNGVSGDGSGVDILEVVRYAAGGGGVVADSSVSNGSISLAEGTRLTVGEAITVGQELGAPPHHRHPRRT
ncbi:hypothetical protein Tco_0849693, partial [Tanacetum coccineum]